MVVRNEDVETKVATCLEKTPYDSNQQLSLQATINPSELFIQLGVTSESQLGNTVWRGLSCWGRARGQQCLSLFSPQCLTPGLPNCSDKCKFSKEGRSSHGGRGSRHRVLGTRLQPRITFLLLWCSVSRPCPGCRRGCGVSWAALQALPSRNKFPK